MVATPTKNSPPDGLKAESLPLIDLRTMSQSELYNLSLCSSPAFDLRRTNDVVIPEIDRRIFSESAASRRQTHSRPRQPNSSTAVARRIRLPGHLRAPVTLSPNDPVIAESKSIVKHLKRLMNETEPEDPPADQSQPPSTATTQVGNGSGVPSGAAELGISREKKRKKKTGVAGNGSELVNSPTHHSQLPSTAITEVGNGSGVPSGAADTEIAGFSVEGERKRKKRRKEKLEALEDGGEIELDIVNKNGVVVDFRALENGDEIFGEELRKRTIGLESEQALLGFLGGLEGKWGSARKRRRIVDSGEFSDALPVGWKLLLALKRQQYRPTLYCRRYISPMGQQFVSCKDAALYLQSYFGLGDSSQPSTQIENGVNESSAGFVQKDDNVPIVTPDSVLPDPTTPSAYAMELSVDGIDNLPEVHVRDLFECYECQKAFDEKDEYFKHLMVFHEKTTRMYSLGSSSGKGLILTTLGHQSKVGHERSQDRQSFGSEMAVHDEDNIKGSEELPCEAIVQKSRESPSPDDNQPRKDLIFTTEGHQSDVGHERSQERQSFGSEMGVHEKDNIKGSEELPSEAIVQKSSKSPPNDNQPRISIMDLPKKKRISRMYNSVETAQPSISKCHTAEPNEKANGGSSSPKELEVVTIPESAAANLDREPILQKKVAESSLPKVASLDCFPSFISDKVHQERSQESHMAIDEKGNSRNSEELLVEAIVEKSSGSPYRDDYQPEISTMDAFASEKANGGSSSHEEVEVTIPETLAANADHEAILQNGAADSSLQEVESLDCFLGISDKEEHGLYKADQSFSFTTGFEELTATEPLDLNFSFLNGQDSPYLPESMNLTNTEGTEEGFNSAASFGSETERYQFTAVCVWCQSNFNYEAVGLEAGSSFVGVMCPACKAKISGQFNMLGSSSSRNSLF